MLVLCEFFHVGFSWLQTSFSQNFSIKSGLINSKHTSKPMACHSSIIIRWVHLRLPLTVPVQGAWFQRCHAYIPKERHIAIVRYNDQKARSLGNHCLSLATNMHLVPRFSARSCMNPQHSLRVSSLFAFPFPGMVEHGIMKDNSWRLGITRLD